MPLEGRAAVVFKKPVQTKNICSKAAVFGEKRLEPGHSRMMPDCYCMDKLE